MHLQVARKQSPRFAGSKTCTLAPSYGGGALPISTKRSCMVQQIHYDSVDICKYLGFMPELYTTSSSVHGIYRSLCPRKTLGLQECKN